jgi:hypothetical protein
MLIQKVFNRKCIHVHKGKENTRRFTHKELALILQNEIGTTAYNKRIPEWIKQAVPSLRCAFI